MSVPTEPLREEHRELLPRIEALKSLADAVEAEGLQQLEQRLAEAESFLTRHLIPHAEAENGALYPLVERYLGTGATATMSRDHSEVGALVRELSQAAAAVRNGAADPASARRLRAVLYGLYAVVRLHFDKEEEIYLPLLDRNLGAEAISEMVRSMEKIAARARSG